MDQIAQEYGQLKDAALPKYLFTSLYGNRMDLENNEEMKMKEDPVSGNKNEDLFGVINEKEADEADETDEADEANEAPVYEFYDYLK